MADTMAAALRQAGLARSIPAAVVTTNAQERHLSGLEALVAGLAANGHGKVLVCGFPQHFPDSYRRHPQVVIWDYNGETRAVPAAVRLVLITRFLRHGAMYRLKDWCAQNGVTFGHRVMGTGEIRALLRPLVGDDAAVDTMDDDNTQETDNAMATAEQTTTAAEDRPKLDGNKFAKGELARMVSKHANLGIDVIKPEAERVHKVLTDLGMRTTVGSVAQCIGQMRIKLGIRKGRKGDAPANGKASKRKVERETPRDAEKFEAPQAQLSAAIADDDQQILQMLTDAVAAMELVRDAIVRRGEKRAQLRQLLKEL